MSAHLPGDRPIAARKLEHLDLCAKADVEAQDTTLLEEVELFHEALPELSLAEIDCGSELFGRHLEAPLLVSGMTGGAERARELNLSFAQAAQKFGFGMGVGSQRAMLLHPDLTATYRVREVAPDILLLANIGAVQARDAGPLEVARLVESIGADALCIHLNAAQELVQDEGDRDFRGCLAAIGRISERMPVIVKETGCGLGPRTLARLRAIGVQWVDVSGRGGTSWTAVESLRGSARQRALGEALREWGIPTAAAVAYAERAGLAAIASGGIRGARDVVSALALGARAASLALPFLRAHERGGAEAVAEEAARLCEGIRAVMLLIGARSLAEIPTAPRVIGPRLQRWLDHAPTGGLAR